MFYFKYSFLAISQPAFTCSKLTVETLEHRLPAGLIGYVARNTNQVAGMGDLEAIFR